MANNQHNFKPLIIDRQDLMVEKTLVKRVKNQATRAIVKENYKKDVIVSGYSVTFLDMIYVSNDKY
jgi:acetylglutamate synthase